MSEEIIDTGYQYASIEKRHELDNTAQELVKAVGKQFVRALIMTPCSYVQPGTEELRGITILLSSDTPVSKELIRSTLGSGTAVYELDTMADNSEIEPEKLWKRKLLFNACTPDRAATDTLGISAPARHHTRHSRLGTLPRQGPYQRCSSVQAA